MDIAGIQRRAMERRWPHNGILAAVALALQSVPALGAQEVPLPAPEARVRFTALDPATGRLATTIGTVVFAAADSVLVRSDRRSALVAARWENVVRLDESAGHRSREATVATAAVIFGAGGATVGWFLGEDCATTSVCVLPRQEFALLMGALGTVTGLAGGLIAHRKDRWSPRAVPGGVGLTSSAGGGAGMVVTFTF
jgi:hypothetical protein